MTKLPPLCRFCGKAIAKRTHTVYFGRSRFRPDDYSTSRTERPRTKEEAQRLLNQQIVSIRWTRAGDRDAWADPAEADYISQVSTWDGESYESRYFCNGDHARQFGVVVAKTRNLGTIEYMTALSRQKEKVEP